MFSCDCCAFLHTAAQALHAAIAPSGVRSRCFAAGVCRFAEFTFWVLLIFNIDVHHSAVTRYVWLNTRRCRSMSPTENFKPLLGRAFVTQFGSFFLPRVLQNCLLVSLMWLPSGKMSLMCWSLGTLLSTSPGVSIWKDVFNASADWKQFVDVSAYWLEPRGSTHEAPLLTSTFDVVVQILFNTIVRTPRMCVVIKA